MTQYEYECLQDLSWMYETSDDLNGSDPMFETSDDVLENCFAGDIDLDNTSYSHSFDSTELEERLLREHKEVMDKLRNLPKRDCIFISDDLPF